MPLARPVSSADVRGSASGSLPAAPAPPGRAREGSAHLSLKLATERSAYVAGQQVKGVLELSVKGQLALGDIGIEFLGVEELRSRDHTSTRRLLSDRIDFQGNGLPPSNAVKAGTRPVQASYYSALPGRTRFAFAFTVPASMPSTCALGSNAQTRYELRAFASSLVDGSVDLRSEKLDVRVIERWGDWRENDWQKGTERTATGALAHAGDGSLQLVASIGKGEWCERPARLFWRSDEDMEVAGKGKMEIRARVRNMSKRHVTGLKVSLIRRLRVLYPEDARPNVEPPVFSSIALTERFHGIDYDVRSGGERDVVLALQVPREECWTVRKGTLFELDVVLRVDAECGFLQKPLSVDLPIWIAHPLSLPNSAHRFADEERARLAPASAPHQAAVTSPLPQSSIPYSPSTIEFSSSTPFPSYSPSTVGFASPAPYHSLSPDLCAPAIAHGALLPLPGTPAPGQHSRHYAASTVSMTSSVSSPAMYPPMTPAPYFPPPPAAPAELYDPIPAAYPAAQTYEAFRPGVEVLSMSRFADSLHGLQLGPVPNPTASALSPAPAHMPCSALPLRAPPAVSSVSQMAPSHVLARPPSRAHTIPSGLDLPLHEAQRVRANSSPTYPNSGAQPAQQYARTENDLSLRTHGAGESARQNSAPHATSSPIDLSLPTASPPRPCASPVPSIRAEISPPTPAPVGVSHMPPPSSASSQSRPSDSSFASPVESPASPGAQKVATAPLETIGEEGESQAGNTARSSMLPEGMIEALRDDASCTSPGRNSAQDLEALVEREEQREEERKAREMVAQEREPSPAEPVSTPASASPLHVTPSGAQKASSSVELATSTTANLSTTSPPARPEVPKREANGLSALEARLARPTTPDLSALQISSPSRSPSPIKPLGSPAPHARNFAAHLDLLGGESETIGSALRARSISRATKYKEQMTLATVGADVPNPSRRSQEVMGRKEDVHRAAPAVSTAEVQEAPHHKEASTSQSTVANWVKSVIPVDEPVAVPVVRDNEVKNTPPLRSKPLSSPSLAAPDPETGSQEPASPSSPRRPLPSPPASPRRALPFPPATGASPSSTRPEPFPAVLPVESAPSVAPAVTSTRPVFTSSRTERDLSPTPSSGKPVSLVDSPRSPVKSSASSPWSSRPSPWTSVGKLSSPTKTDLPTRQLSVSAEAHPEALGAPVDEVGRKVVNVAELKGLKREAVDRVTGWLEEASTDEGVPASRDGMPDRALPVQIQPPKRYTIDFGKPASALSASSPSLASLAHAAPVLNSPSSTSLSRREKQREPTVAQLLAAETRAAMRAAATQADHDAPVELKRSSAVERGLNGYLAALQNDSEVVAKVRDGHQSAKRAQPGKVRSVATIWAERVEEADRERMPASPVPGAPVLGHKATKSLSALQLGALAAPTSCSQRALAPVGNVYARASPTRDRPVSLQFPASSSATVRPLLNERVGPVGTPTIRSAASTTTMRVPSGSANKLAASESAPTGWTSSAAGADTERGAGTHVKDLLARYQRQLA